LFSLAGLSLSISLARSERLLKDTTGVAANAAGRSPRSGLSAAGVAKGTLLFKGIKDGNYYSGTAYLFSRCGTKAYQVSGPVSEDQRSVTLSGQSPVVGSNCTITNFTSDTLVFNFKGD
jgi:hypothetical protein